MNTDSAPYLSQAERLAFAPIACHSIELDETPECAALNNHPLSARNAGFVMPSRARIGIVSILPHGEADNDEGDGAIFDDNESDELPAETWAPYVLPSSRTRGAVYAELRGMGYAWND